MNDPKIYYLRIDEYDTFYIRDTEDELEIRVGNEEHIKYDNVVEIINLLNKLCKEKYILKNMIIKDRMRQWYSRFFGEITIDELVDIMSKEEKDIANNIEHEVEDILRKTGW